MPIRALAALLLLASCAPAAAPPRAAAPAAAPSPPGATSPRPAYRLQPGDQLGIRLYLTPELNEDVTIRPDGRISTQLADGIEAAGRTPEQLASALRAAYAAELKDPRITVELRAAAPTRIYVTGEVPSPGEITANGPPLTLLQAVAKAGGLRVTGDAAHVIIIRRGETDRPVVLTAQYQQAASGADPTADITLQPFDIVVVPRTDVAEAYVWVNQHIQQFVPVSWGFSYNMSPLVK